VPWLGRPLASAHIARSEILVDLPNAAALPNAASPEPAAEPGA
jgi:hypothetical protein